MVNETQTKIWIMEIRVPIKQGQGFVWTAVKCSNGKTYTYDSEADALKMLDICYPTVNSKAWGETYSEERRVRQINSNEVKNE